MDTSYFLEKADANMPEIAQGIRYSDQIVEIIADDNAYLGVGVNALGINKKVFVSGDKLESIVLS